MRSKALRYSETCAAYPTRLRWAVFDATKFEQLLARLAELNTSMLYFLDAHQTRQHHALQRSTYMHLLLTHDKLEQLVQLVQSIGLNPVSQRQEEPQAPGEADEDLRRLAQLARLKAHKVAIENGTCEAAAKAGLEVPPATKLDLDFLKLGGAGRKSPFKPGRSGGTFNDVPVWIEWKCYDAHNVAWDQTCVENRVSQLSVFLEDKSKPAEFRVPNCLGYVHDPECSRFGLVFQQTAAGAASMPKSVYDLLRCTLKPSLSRRVNMARRIALTVRYLHASNWLHKGLRSENIVFQGADDMSSSLLCGFDYSRPASTDEVTELPDDNRQQDLYRHPDVQFDVPRDGEYGFAKEHDIYSLGVVMFEIGVWHPVHEFLGISLNQIIPRPVIRSAKDRLLEKESMALLQAEAGDVFAKATMLCLNGALLAGAGESQAQLHFWAVVLDALDSIVI